MWLIFQNIRYIAMDWLCRWMIQSQQDFIKHRYKLIAIVADNFAMYEKKQPHIGL